MTSTRSLTALTVRGVALQTGGTMFLSVLGLARGVILRRWFLPAELGFLETALLPLSITVRLSQLGTRQAVMRQKERFTEIAGTALTLDFLFSSAAYLALLLAAPLVARWFDAPDLTLWIRVLAITVYSTTLSLPAAAWDRAMRFGVSKVPRAVGTVTTVVVAGALVWGTSAGREALLWSAVAGFAVEHALYWVLAPLRPRPRWNRADARALAGFSLPLLAAAVFGFIVFEGDDIMVRTFGTDADLAIYRAAFEWPFYLTTLVAMTSAVLYPALLQTDEIQRRGRAFVRSSRWLAVITIPVGVAMVVFAEPLVHVLYGAEWAPAVPLLRIFAAAFTVRVATGYNWHLLPMSRGDTTSFLGITAVSAALTVAIGLPLIATWGGMGGAVTNVIVAFGWAVPARLRVIRREVGDLEFLRDLPYPALAAVPAAAAGWAAGRLDATFGAPVALAAGLASFSLVYTVCLTRLDRRLLVEAREMAGILRSRSGDSASGDPDPALPVEPDEDWP